jgi:magnesium chelatase family protein
VQNKQIATHFARVHSAELRGIEARPVAVEVDVHVGLHSFVIVGLADKALSEARERVSAALKNSGVKPPSQENRKIVVNLAPADVRKTGAQYDAAIAVAYMLSTGQIAPFDAARALFAGELALDGSFRPLRGALAIAAMAKARGMADVYVPAESAREAAMVAGIRVFAVRSLAELVGHLERRAAIAPVPHEPPAAAEHGATLDISDIKGQASAKRAAVIAAAGGHHLLMTGAPGAGKTMLAHALQGMLPPLGEQEALEVANIHSAAGMPALRADGIPRPFRAPHHTASQVSIVGGGKDVSPGEITLAHRGVLFLDELPEFHRDVLEALREPLESGTIAVSRAAGRMRFPAGFMLVCAMNPCPCGYFGDTRKECSCAPHERARYRKKISGPIMDRIDLQVQVARVEAKDLAVRAAGGEGALCREAVRRVRALQCARQGMLNSALRSRECEALPIAPRARETLRAMWDKAALSARGYYRVIRVARTIADIDNALEIKTEHVTEAFAYRLREN